MEIEKDIVEENNKEQEHPEEEKIEKDEYLKLKEALSRANKEAADFKKKLKEKMTDEEKKAEEIKAKEQLFEQLKRENATMKISSELITAGYDKKDVEALSQCILDNDMESLTKKLAEIRASMVESITKTAEENFKKSNKLPNGSGNDDTESIGSRLGKKFTTANAAGDYYRRKE